MPADGRSAHSVRRGARAQPLHCMQAAAAVPTQACSRPRRRALSSIALHVEPIRQYTASSWQWLPLRYPPCPARSRGHDIPSPTAASSALHDGTLKTRQSCSADAVSHLAARHRASCAACCLQKLRTAVWRAHLLRYSRSRRSRLLCKPSSMQGARWPPVPDAGLQWGGSGSDAIRSCAIVLRNQTI